MTYKNFLPLLQIEAMAEVISNIRRAKNWGFCIHQKAYCIKMELHSKGHSSNTASELNHRMLIVIPHTSCSICNVTLANVPRFISYTERATWKTLDFYPRPSSFKSTAEGWEEGCLGRCLCDALRNVICDNCS